MKIGDTLTKTRQGFDTCIHGHRFFYLGPQDVAPFFNNMRNVELTKMFVECNIPRYVVCMHNEPRCKYNEGTKQIKGFPWDASKQTAIYGTLQDIHEEFYKGQGILLMDLAQVLINFDGILTDRELFKNENISNLIGKIVQQKLNKCSSCDYHCKKYEPF